MIILTIRTDKPEAEIGLYDDEKVIAYQKWQAHRQLAETIHSRIGQLLEDSQQDLKKINGLVVFQGPGSFTGLRIGISVANALADSLEIPIAGTTGEAWITDGAKRLADGGNDGLVVPEYGAPPHITKPRK